MNSPRHVKVTVVARQGQGRVVTRRRRDAAAGYIAGLTAGVGAAWFAIGNPYAALFLLLAGVVVFPLTIWKATT